MMLQSIWSGCGMVIGRHLKQNSSTLLNKVHNYHANKKALGQGPVCLNPTKFIGKVLFSMVCWWGEGWGEKHGDPERTNSFGLISQFEGWAIISNQSWDILMIPADLYIWLFTPSPCNRSNLLGYFTNSLTNKPDSWWNKPLICWKIEAWASRGDHLLYTGIYVL